MTIARTGRNHWMLATGLGFGLLRLVKGDCKRVQGRLFQKLTWNASVGWIAAIIIGGAAAWLAEQFMTSDMGC